MKDPTRMSSKEKRYPLEFKRRIREDGLIEAGDDSALVRFKTTISFDL